MADVKIHQHYFIGLADYWISEFDPEQRIFYGYACLGDKQMAEWGYGSLDELMELKVPISLEGSPLHMEVDRDLYWSPQSAHQVDDIVKCYKVQGLESLMPSYK